MRLLTKILIIPTMAILFADPPDWQDNPGAYQYTATISGGIVLNIADEQMGEVGDMFAAFDDDGNVRGVGLMLSPPFGPYQGTPVFEVQLRSNDAGDILHFQYYDASEDAILNVAEPYEFIINDIIGDVQNPMIYNFAPVTLSFTNVSSTGIDIHYESNTEISGFQFEVEGVTITSVSGGDAEEYGLSISFSSIVLGFSITGASIPSGSGTLLSIEFEEIVGNQILEVKNVIISGSDGESIQSSGPGIIEINSPPELFSFYQSTLQAFYMFNVVIINESEVESNDWVGAFNGEICIGARKWDTTLCNGGICDVPVMGDDGSVNTEGYIAPGGIPAFKLYDASSGNYYDAVPSDNLPWVNLGIINIASLEANIFIPGCTDPDYCNYDPSATEDDGSCDYLCTGCTDETACNYSENATIDDSSCYYEGENYNCDGNCIATSINLDENGFDCAGVCGGAAELDLCGECDNYIATNGFQPDFPYGDCDCLGTSGGSAETDKCGECDDNNSNDCIQDCSGEWGGSSNEDNCGTCDDNASNDCNQDCSGAWGGELVIDECGICGGPGSTSECGCSDIPDGSCDCDGNTLDQCGICNGNNSTCLDCAGEPNGNAVLDNCGNCDNDLTNDCMQDCNGIWGGIATVDICGICDNDISNDCIQDCAGIWGGVAEVDECAICDGDGPEENYDCDGNCVGEVNCLGECDAPDGQYSPNFQCQNGNVVCNPADCNSLAIPVYLLPDEFGISKIFPNPFNPVTQIHYEISHYGKVIVHIFDIQGREIDEIFNSYQNSGKYSINWNAGTNASGMYFVGMTLQSGNTTISRDMKKILYLK